jgi:hypothetical protein
MEVTQQASGDGETIYGQSVNQEKMFASKIIEKMFYWVQCLTPVIPTLQEVEIGRITVHGQPQQKVSKTHLNK